MLDNKEDLNYVELIYLSDCIIVNFYLSKYMKNKVKVLYGYYPKINSLDINCTIMSYNTNMLSSKKMIGIQRSIPERYKFNDKQTVTYNNQTIISYRMFVDLKDSFPVELQPHDDSELYKVNKIITLLSKDNESENAFKEYMKSYYLNIIECIEDDFKNLQDGSDE